MLSLAVEGLVETGNLFLKPLYQLWLDFVSVFPSIVVAILLLILGYFVAFLIGHVVKWLLQKVGLDKYIKEAGCKIYATGYESNNNEILKKYNKKTSK